MKQGGLTTLELQAHNMAREDDDDYVEVTDEAKYNALLEQRKNRRAVSCLNFEFLVCNLSRCLSISKANF